MKVKEWRDRIRSDCAAAGTYKEAFDKTIDVLAGILARRDEVTKRYETEGCVPVISYKNKNGDVISRANPLLALEDKLNGTALSYFKELGLTPSGLRKIDESAMKPKKKSILVEALKELDAELE